MHTGERLPSFRRLRVFDAIAERRNFSRGAAAVHLSQPAATQAIFNLEKWVEAPLFNRSKGGTHLTDEGEVFRTGVRRLFDQVEAMLAAEVCQGSAERARLVAPRIKTSHLSVLRAIAEAGSLDLAAGALGMSRAAVQRVARDLEATLGAQFFEKTPRGLAANPLGLRIDGVLQSACQEIARAVENLRELQQRCAARLFIGAQPLSSTSLLAASINDLLEVHPQTQIRIIEGSYQHLLQELQHGRLDMMFGALKCPQSVERLREIPLFSEPYCIAARVGHPLTLKRRVTLDDLSRVDWVLPGPGTQRRRAFDALFRDHPRSPTSRIDATSVSAQIALLACSDRVALLTPLELALDPHLGRLAPVRFATRIARKPDGVTMRDDWRANPVRDAFLAALRRRVAAAVRRSALVEADAPALESAG